jgi:drug/metabolite transporter (DMT)-like permease
VRAKDWLVFIVLGILWGSSFLWIKIAIQEISPLLLVTLRLSFAIITLTIAAIIARPLWPQSKRLWLILVFFGLINTAIPYFLISWGEQYIDSAVAAILNSSTPLFAMLIAHIFLDDDRITLPRLTGLLIGFVGIVIIVSRDLGQNESVSQYTTLILLGQAAVLLASLLYAGSAVFAKRNLKGLSPVVQGLVPIVGASIFLWLLVPIVEDPISLPELPITWISIAWLGLLGTGFAFILYFYLIHSVGPTRTTLVTYIFPLVGLVLGVIVLGEKLDWRLAVGAALIIISVAVVNQSR